MLLDVTEETGILQEKIQHDYLNNELSGKVQQWTYDNVCQAIEKEMLPRQDEESFIMIEISNQPLMREVFHTLYQLQLRGYVPILAGIEKDKLWKNNMHMIDQLIHNGVLIHVDALSITGKNGRISQKNALKLCKRRVVHLVTAPKEEKNPSFMRQVDELIKRKTSLRYVALLKENKKNIMLKRSFHIERLEKRKWLAKLRKPFALLENILRR